VTRDIPLSYISQVFLTTSHKLSATLKYLSMNITYYSALEIRCHSSRRSMHAIPILVFKQQRKMSRILISSLILQVAESCSNRKFSLFDLVVADYTSLLLWFLHMFNIIYLNDDQWGFGVLGFKD
jgi:hypothetical protein